MKRIQLLLKISIALAGAAFVCSMSACDQEVPETETSDSSDDDSGENDTDSSMTGETDGEDAKDELATHYPLIVGSKLVYESRDASGTLLGDEEVSVSAWDMADSSLFGVIMQDSEDEDGQSSRSTIVRKNGAAYRVHKEVLVSEGDATEIVDYDPGFVRFDEAWATWEVGKEQEYEYLRDSSVDNGAEMRVHRYKLLGLNETVEVPAGTFQCVHVSRMRLSGASAGETVEFWYAKGVGKVRELRLESGKQELLKSFSIPGAR